jgi:hypothetical protein
LQTPQTVLPVQGVGGSNVNYLNISILNQSLVAGVPVGNVKHIAKRICRSLAPRTHGDQFGIGQNSQPPGELFGDIAGAHNTPSNFVCHDYAP